MYHNHLTDILFLAANHGFRFVPAAGPGWKGDFDLGKQPLNSIHEATADPAVLTAWAEKYKGCNWLYVPGDTQAVLDVDPRHGGDGVLAELEREHGPLPRTPRVRTGRGDGGCHLHLAVPAGLAFDRDILGNVGLTLACGGKRGFVVPPCRHALGGQYAWELPPWDAAPAPCPGWLLRLAQADAPAAAKPPAGTEAAVPGPPPDHGPLEFVWGGGDRLAAHPGSVAKALGGEGRRPTLVSLLGRELGLGRSTDDLEPDVLAWAGRCTPPLDDREALRHLHSMARRDAARHGDGRHHTRILLATPAPADEGSQPEAPAEEGGRPAANHTSFLRSAGDDAPAEPEVAPPFLTHGWVGDFARAVAPQIEGSIEPVVACVLSCFGSAVGPGPSVRAGAGRHRANLFGVVVAPSGVGKSEPWDVASAVMGYADPDWCRAAPTGLGSGEGLIERLQDNPVAFAVESEFGAVLTKARRDGSTLGPTVCNAWDGRTMEVANRGGHKLRAEGHHVSIWANITDAELHKRIANSLESVNGFGNRFLWLAQRRVRYLPRGGDLRCLMPLAGPLGEAVARAKRVGQVRWGDEAGAMWDAAYARLCDVQGEHWSLGRARSQALRLVLVYALLDGADVIGPGHVAAGLSAWRWAERSARAVFGVGPVPAAVNPGPPPLTFVMGGVEQHQHTCDEIVPSADAPAPADDRAVLADRVLGRITAKPGTGRGELMRAVNAKAAPLGDALAALHADGKAHPRLVPGKGRPAECWFPGPDPGDGTNEGSKPPAGPDPAADLPSFVWAGADDAASGTKEERPGGGEPPTGGGDFLPSFEAEGQHDGGDGGCGVVVPGTNPGSCPDTPPGRREPSAGWQAAYEKAQVEYQQELRHRRGDDDPPMTEEQFFGELNKVRPRPPAA